MPAGTSRKTVALILSGVFPGLGQLYNRQPLKGAAFLIVGVVLCWRIGLAIPQDVNALIAAPPGKGVVILACVLLAVWLWSVVDAWRVAR